MSWRLSVLTLCVGLISTGVFTGCIPQTREANISPSVYEARPTLEPITPTLLPSPRAIDDYFVPAYYPDSYEDIIEASKNEQGLVIY